MEKIVRFHKSLANVLGLLIVLLVLIIAVDAGGRFLFNKPLPGPIEVSKVILGWVLFLSLAYALVQGTHIQVQLFLLRCPPRLRLVADILIDTLGLCFFGVITYSGWKQFWESFTVGETMPAPIWIPFWLAKLAVPVGCLMFAGQFGINAVSRLIGALRMKDEYVVKGREEA